MKESEKVALSITIGVIIGLLIIIIFFQYDKINKSNLQKTYDKGYETGYVKGFKDGQKNGVEESIKIMHQNTDDYINNIKNR